MFQPIIYNGVNRDKANAMPWYETKRRIDGQKFPAEWTEPQLGILWGYELEVRDQFRDLMTTNVGKRHICIIGDVRENEGRFTMTVLYQDYIGPEREDTNGA